MTRAPAETEFDVIPRVIVEDDEEQYCQALQREIDISRLEAGFDDHLAGRIEGLQWALERFEEGRW